MKIRTQREHTTYRLLMSTSAFLQTRFANRRPTPLMEVRANMIFCLPSTLVLSTRRICWKSSFAISDCNHHHQNKNLIRIPWQQSPIIQARMKPLFINAITKTMLEQRKTWTLKNYNNKKRNNNRKISRSGREKKGYLEKRSATKKPRSIRLTR